MKKRRFSITQDEADLIINALQGVIDILNSVSEELTAREKNQLRASAVLLNKLLNYNWEV